MSNINRNKEPERAEMPEDMRKMLNRQKDFERNAVRTAGIIMALIVACVGISYLGMAGILKQASGWLLVGLLVLVGAGIAYSRLKGRG